MKTNYWLTLETDTTNVRNIGSINYETSTLGYETTSLNKAINIARDKAIDYSEYKGKQVICVHSDTGLKYVIGCGKRKGNRI